VSSTLTASRGIQALLAHLQGNVARGSAMVRSTGLSGSVPKGAFAVPVINGQTREDALVFVRPNQATADGSWFVTSGGAEVDIESVQGGTHVNLPAGTELRWIPALSGVEARSLVVGAMTGGDRSGPLRQVRYFKDLGGQQQARALYNASVTDYPAVLLAWDSSIPADGSSQAFYGPNATRPGRGVRVWRHEWAIHLITSRLDTADERTREGDQLRDYMCRLLTDRVAVRGLRVSLDPGTQMMGAKLLMVTPTVYVDEITFGTAYTLSKYQLPDDPEPQVWSWTRMQGVLPAQAPTQSEINLPDQTVPMT